MRRSMFWWEALILSTFEYNHFNKVPVKLALKVPIAVPLNLSLLFSVLLRALNHKILGVNSAVVC